MNHQLPKIIGFVLGPILFLFIYFYPDLFNESLTQKVIAIAIWMVIWWITEAVSISVTALIPLVFFPLLGIIDMKTTAANYGSPIVFLFFGGFVLALALEKVELHKRIALNIIKFTGTSPDKVVLGFMISTAFLSMWISNTATTILMLPIAISVIDLLAHDADGFSSKDRNFALSIMLCIAFSANIGGISTLIGTPPNTVLAGFLESEYGREISFFDWIRIGLPFSVLMLICCYWVLVKWIYKSNLKAVPQARAFINDQINNLGVIRKDEKFVLAIFSLAIFLWVFRTSLNTLTDQINFSDAGISVLIAFLLFCIPLSLKERKFIIEWQDTVKLPWGILILFGGGLALANGLSTAGVIDSIGNFISEQKGLSITMVALFLISVMLFMTELMSNVALVAIFAPVVAGISLGLEVEMLYLLIPIAMASSCAFMLPMATPPNAIVFASGHVKVYEMAKAGIVLNLVAIFLILLVFKYLIPLVY